MVVNFYIRRDDEIRKEQARREIKEKQFELAFLIGAGLVRHSINSMRQTLGEINSHNETQRTISRNKGPWFLKELSYCSDAYSGNMHSYFCDTVCTPEFNPEVRHPTIKRLTGETPPQAA